ncbi:hypothetical protein JAAARDRAFT_127225 [Jaapia argillacea MUCL 33604]|uniref:DNA polymerase V n=1 Tax=Jaapia argillacea MUCL 33604 TaxID=933084 RepID=A0A067PXK1_9AGAM|nr:hypothetical protein JAAARDRAFT_127225 [Jaapia argillacea MUCL 33604]
MSTTLPLFWHLSSNSKKERIEASVKLIGTLEQFQAQFVPKEASEPSSEDEDQEDSSEGQEEGGLDALNAQDVSYSIRRLIRGLASPRESSRLGFAVALTELLSRINTVTCSQILSLILDSSKTQGSMTGQEERDMLFARLFGLTSIIQSGLLLRQTPLPTSSTGASSLIGFRDLVTQLLTLGEKKSWLRENAWWTLGLAVDGLNESTVPWKEEAVEETLKQVFGGEEKYSKGWFPEKVALAVKLQAEYPGRNWRQVLVPTFKHPDLLSTPNLATLAKVLKVTLHFESGADDEEEEGLKSTPASWKPKIHYVWDILLDNLLPPQGSGRQPKGSFQEFFRIVVDESFFAATASQERKYWGFQIFQNALRRASVDDVPMLFTKNFMRTWINHLSNNDRYLHKAARQVATEMQSVVEKNPTIGFTLILQLTGVNGNKQFDKLTRTKTVESILTSMDADGINSYIDYLLKQVNEGSLIRRDSRTDMQVVNSRRAWIVDQLAALIRNGAIPKSDDWIQLILDWLVVHGLFVVKKKSSKSIYRALHAVPSPAFSEDLQGACRSRLLSCLADLTAHTASRKTGGDKPPKMSGVASDGKFWVAKVFATIQALERETKYVESIVEFDEEDVEIHKKAQGAIAQLETVSGSQAEPAKGAELLLLSTLVHQYCADEDEKTDTEALEACIDAASRLLPPAETKRSKKSRKSESQPVVSSDELPAPVDVMVDTIIGFLEQSTLYMRTVANQVFSLLSSEVKESAIDLILAQLERRDPADLAKDDDEDDEMEEDQDEDEDAGSKDDDDESADSDESGVEGKHDAISDASDDEEPDSELRNKIEEALRVNGVEAREEDSDEESEEAMDDDQMMAIDEQLAAVFKTRANEKRGVDLNAQREASHFKNRVLDLVDIFVKKRPTSPEVVRIIIPILSLVTGSGSDEKQLSDKASGILRSRIGKSKDIPSNFDNAQVIAILDDLHSRARKVHSPDALATISQCSLYLTRLLLGCGEEASVVSAYRHSLTDFVTRKNSHLNSKFIQDFIQRYPGVAWNLRSDLVDLSSRANNTYRQCQVFQLLQALLSQAPTLTEKKDEALMFIPTLRRCLSDTVSAACGEIATLTSAQLKDIFKVGLLGIRQTKRIISSPDDLPNLWLPATWDSLRDQLSGTERFKASTALLGMCKQMAQTSRAPGDQAATGTKAKAPKGPTTKRKAAEITAGGEGEGLVSKKAKRKKGDKAKP